jgi:hypothetical protein
MIERASQLVVTGVHGTSGPNWHRPAGIEVQPVVTTANLLTTTSLFPSPRIRQTAA